MDAKTAIELLKPRNNIMHYGEDFFMILPSEGQQIAALIERQSQEITRLEGQHVFDNSQIVEYEGIVRVQAAKIERQEKMLAMTPQDIADLLAETERLTSCLSFEQNYLSRVGTHADGCYKWGPGHWDCAVQEIERLQAENEGLKIPKQHSCNNCKNNYRSVDDKDCAYCINSFALPNWEGLK